MVAVGNRRKGVSETETRRVGTAMSAAGEERRDTFLQLTRRKRKYILL